MAPSVGDSIVLIFYCMVFDNLMSIIQSCILVLRFSLLNSCYIGMSFWTFSKSGQETLAKRHISPIGKKGFCRLTSMDKKHSPQIIRNGMCCISKASSATLWEKCLASHQVWLPFKFLKCPWHTYSMSWHFLKTPFPMNLIVKKIN